MMMGAMNGSVEGACLHAYSAAACCVTSGSKCGRSRPLSGQCEPPRHWCGHRCEARHAAGLGRRRMGAPAVGFPAPRPWIEAGERTDAGSGGGERAGRSSSNGPPPLCRRRQLPPLTASCCLLPAPLQPLSFGNSAWREADTQVVDRKQQRPPVVPEQRSPSTAASTAPAAPAAMAAPTQAQPDGMAGAEGLYCSTAGAYFQSKDELADHYRSDFHRWDLREGAVERAVESQLLRGSAAKLALQGAPLPALTRPPLLRRRPPPAGTT